MTFVTRLLRIKENRNQPRVKMTMQCEKSFTTQVVGNQSKRCESSNPRQTLAIIGFHVIARCETGDQDMTM
jgi:hypothetical protein